jgi:hypothetical protein
MAILLPENDPASPVQKSGWKTSEFWLSLLSVLVGALLASDALPTDSPVAKGLGLVASMLGALGYQVSRAMVKSSGNKAAAFVEAAKVGAPANPTLPSP